MATRLNRSRGFTLAELMLALAIGTVIMLAISIMFTTSHKAQSEIRKSSQQIESAFIGAQMLTEQIQLAGFYGELSSPPAPGAIPPNVCAFPGDLAFHVLGVDNMPNSNPPYAAATCIPEKVVPTSDVLVVRRVGTCPAGAANCADTLVDGNMYMQVSRCGQDTSLGLPAFYLGARGGGTPFDLHMNCPAAAAIGSIAAAPLLQYRTQIYYVAENNQPGDGIPTLKRIDLMGGAATTTGIASGIANMQIQYGIDGADTNADTIPDSFLATQINGAADAFVSTPTTAGQWNNVVSLRVWLLGRNFETSNDYVDTKSYQLGDLTVGPFNDRFKRDVLTREIRLTNPAGRRE